MFAPFIVYISHRTPAMSRPKELFTQLHAIAPTYFSNPWNFVEQYCDPKRTFNNAVDDSGASCLSEL
jgi:SWI/SNF-related matrix-associated actin-dependent regulator 1 of chromatin subfamily A